MAVIITINWTCILLCLQTVWDQINAFMDVFCNWKYPHCISEHERNPDHYVQHANINEEVEWH